MEEPICRDIPKLRKRLAEIERLHKVLDVEIERTKKQLDELLKFVKEVDDLQIVKYYEPKYYAKDK